MQTPFIFLFTTIARRPNIDYNVVRDRCTGPTNIHGGNKLIRRLLLISLTVAFILPAVCCSTVKMGKDIAIDNPMHESKTKQSLYDARQEVEKSRYALDRCLKANSGDQTRCQSEKAAYDRDVENYANLQSP